MFIKGGALGQDKTVNSKFVSVFSMGMLCRRRLYFSKFVMLMNITNCEKQPKNIINQLNYKRFTVLINGESHGVSL